MNAGTMTVRELRDALAAFDQDLDVTVVLPNGTHCDPELPQLGDDNEGDRVVCLEVTP